MESINLREPSLRSDRPQPRLMSRPPRRERTPTPRPTRGHRLALVSDFETDIPATGPEYEDFSDLDDTRLEDLKRERRARRWFFKLVGVLALAAMSVVLVGMSANPKIRSALSSWATFGVVQ